jgi:hypothetical protein
MTRQPAADIADEWPPVLRIDCHAHDGIDDCQRICAGIDTKARVFPDVGLVWRQLRDNRFAGLRAACGDDLC